MSEHRNFEVIFPKPDGGLYRIYSENFEVINSLGAKYPIKLGKVLKLAISPFERSIKKRQVLAILTDAGEMIIAECDFDHGQATKTQIENFSSDPPEGITWCGSGAVVLLYQSKLTILGKSASGTFDFTDPGLGIEGFRGYYLENEIDGMRVLTNQCTYFIERVADSTKHVLDALSTGPSVQIINAYYKWLKKDPGANDAIKEVKEEGEEKFLSGIEDLVNAATYEFDPEFQKYLLKVASFGKNFLPMGKFDADKFVQILKDLRIINQLHVPKVYLVVSVVWQSHHIRTVQEVEAEAGDRDADEVSPLLFGE
eukprot:TRINITY_DN4823_c0_g2_i1.p1 TRINITY_DN4823_c0_g2~~TRINITY_DN4823_c0_g2_i1.p1  ORF type:complete len:312 (+),score=45.63 TRINITY_DN4823_c0_g2_i1:793-1728(+)